MQSRELREVIKRIAREMQKVSQAAHKDPRVNQRFLELFMGLGCALAICWEVAGGHKPGTANKMKPLDLFKWAMELPESDLPSHVDISKREVC